MPPVSTRHLHARKILILVLVIPLLCILPQNEIAFSSTSYPRPVPFLDSQGRFPIAVWLQSPKNATLFKELGVNLYIGLWKGPTAQQLKDLHKAEMNVICQQNEIALKSPYQNIILGWLQQDEPDNAQKRKFGVFYKPPISPAVIQQRYSKMKQIDPTRPVLLNLGQGLAWDNWHGRGTRTNHPEDYAEYAKGGDIISFDIYPVTHRSSMVRGRLEFVAKGVQRLEPLVSPNQKVWNVIGVSRGNDADTLPTPAQVRSQVWMSIIHGSSGIIYFTHQFKPHFIEAAVFKDQAMMLELKKLNNHLQQLAKAINSPDTDDIKKLITTSPDVPIAAISKRYGTHLYILSVAMRNKVTSGKFEFNKSIPNQEAEVLDENRKVKIKGGILIDLYKPYEPHIYKINL